MAETDNHLSFFQRPTPCLDFFYCAKNSVFIDLRLVYYKQNDVNLVSLHR